MNSKITRAPVLITVYNRLEHFKKCISSLKGNIDAINTPLFIAIDAPFKDSDIESNNEIFLYSTEITGFKSIEIIRRDKNIGMYANSKLARERIFKDYDSLIRLEDDNITSTYFLKFINDGLNHYKDDRKIFAICGYSEPIYLDDVTGADDVYFRRGFSSFGFGVWREKIKLVDSSAERFYTEFLNPSYAYRFIKSVGSNIYCGLLVAKRKKEIYPDMSYIFHIYINDLYSVHPKKTLIRNIGQDGSGLHSGVNDILQNQEIYDGMLDVRIESYNENIEIRKRLNVFHNVRSITLFKYFLYYFFNYLRHHIKFVFLMRLKNENND